jgi:beta-phosphoglucomutase-like phosphatase (HAD superfamily)
VLKLSAVAAVIFDMDGLVLDTESTYVSAWQQAAAVMGYTLADDFCGSLSGLGFKEVEQALLACCGADFNLHTFKRLSGVCWRDSVQVHGINTQHGFTELLDYIVQQQLPYCLATNSRAANAYECLELAGLKAVFPTLITRDDVRHAKPAPDIFLAAAKRLQVPISQCLVLEDSHAGIVAATRAGAKSVFVPSTGCVDPLTIELCDLMVADLAQALIALKA